MGCVPQECAAPGQAHQVFGASLMEGDYATPAISTTAHPAAQKFDGGKRPDAKAAAVINLKG